MARSDWRSIVSVVVDESVSRGARELALHWLKEQGLCQPAMLDIAASFPGLADERILASLLGPQALLITTDRLFHNRTLALGFRSLYVGGAAVNAKPLQGICIPKERGLPKAEELEEGGFYAPIPAALTEQLLPVSEKEKKTLRTRRRRIRNHFGGQHNLSELAISLSWLARPGGILLGIRLRVSASNGMKALDASESYLFEQCGSADALSVALCSALAIPIQLMLCCLKTAVFYDHADSIQVNPAYAVAFERLRECYPQLTFQPTFKGARIEQLRQKIRLLSWVYSNEIRPGSLTTYLQRIAAGEQQPD